VQPQVTAAVKLLLLVVLLLAAACDRGVLLCIMLAVSSTLTAPPLWPWGQCRAELLHLVGVLPAQRCWSVSMCSSQPRTAPLMHMHRQSQWHHEPGFDNAVTVELFGLRSWAIHGQVGQG
jgi:hypothetical protein